MKQGRGPWYLLTGLMMGLVVGLGYAWFLDPIEYSNASPQSLKSEYKDDYRSMIALSYQVNGDLGRTLGRLTLLKDEDMSEVLNMQAQRILARSGDEKQARALAELAVVLKGESLTTLSTQIASNNAPAEQLLTTQEPAAPSGTDIPDEDTDVIETKIPSATPQPTFTLRPSASPLPGVDVPFVFVSAEEICDPELPEGLFQVYILDRSGEGMAGVRVHVTWDGGEEYFYTGLYPQFSLGYADYQTSDGVAYALRAGESGETVRDLAAPACGEEDDAYTGGLLLRFTEP